MEATVREPNMLESRWSTWPADPGHRVTSFPSYFIPRTLVNRNKLRDEILGQSNKLLHVDPKNLRISRNTHPNLVRHFISS